MFMFFYFFSNLYSSFGVPPKNNQLEANPFVSLSLLSIQSFLSILNCLESIFAMKDLEINMLCPILNLKRSDVCSGPAYFGRMNIKNSPGFIFFPKRPLPQKSQFTDSIACHCE